MNDAVYQREYQRKHRVRLRRQAYKRFLKNKETIYKRVNEWRRKHLAQQREYHRNYYLAHCTKRRRQMRSYGKGRWVYRPEKDIPRAKFKRAIKSGLIKRPSRCSDCQTRCKPEGHHSDYGKPLNVEWLCARCHGKRHRKPLPNAVKS